MPRQTLRKQDPAGPGCIDDVLSITVRIVAHLFVGLNYFSIIFFLRAMALQLAIAIAARRARAATATPGRLRRAAGDGEVAPRGSVPSAVKLRRFS